MSEDEFIEFSSEEIDVPIQNLTSPDEDTRKISLHPSTPILSSARKPVEKPSKEHKIRKYTLLSLLSVAVLFTLHKVIWKVIERDKVKQTTQEAAPAKFSFDPELAVTAAQKLIEGDLSQALQNETTEQAATLFKKQIKSTAQAQQNPTLILETYPNYYIVKTDTQQEIYVIQDGDRHAVDLSATVGYNSVKTQDFTQFNPQKNPQVRIILHQLEEHLADRYYGCLSASLPHQEGTFHLRFEKYTNVGKTLESALNKGKDLKYTVEISPYGPTEENFISNVYKKGWVFTPSPEVDMENFQLPVQ